VGSLVFNDHRHREVRPRRSRKTVLTILSELEAFNRRLPLASGNDNSLAGILDTLRRIARPGTSIYLVSDFYGAEDPAVREHLFRLAQHSEITALACADPLESALPPAGRYAITDGQRRSELLTADRRLRQNYQEEQAQRMATLETDLQRLGIPLLRASTGDSPFLLLQRYFGAQGR